MSDEFGKKIYYYNVNKNSIRSSSLSKIIKKTGFKNFDKKGITSFLTFRFPIDNLTMFQDFRKVPCGCRIIGGKEEFYWYPKFDSKHILFERALKIVEKLLLNSIKKITSSKKIGVALSGGLDSSLLVALTRKIYPKVNFHTYSIGFNGDDEFEYSRIIAKKFESRHKEKVLNPEDYIGKKSLLKPLIRLKAEPLHPNEIALAEIGKMAKKDGCDIVLTGEGSDDIFGGYGENLRMYMNYKKDRPFFEFFLENYRYFSLKDRRIIKKKYLVSDIEILNSALTKNEIPSDIKNSIFYFIQKIHTVGLVTRVVNAMKFNNIECGLPYTNINLVNFVNSLPFDYKVHWKSSFHKRKAKDMYFRKISEKMDVPKYLIKKFGEKYLPYEVIYRPKYGFPVPFDEWFKNLNKWPLDEDVFNSNDISEFNGWKKFMLINLDTFIKEFKIFRIKK